MQFMMVLMNVPQVYFADARKSWKPAGRFSGIRITILTTTNKIIKDS